MANVNRPTMNSTPPEAEGRGIMSKAKSMNAYIPGGATCAVGAPHFETEQLPTSARA
jgi:hypothetical protein